MLVNRQVLQHMVTILEEQIQNIILVKAYGSIYVSEESILYKPKLDFC